MVNSQITTAPHVANGLRDLDPRLKLTFFGEKAEARYGIVPGRWHVWLENDPGKVDMYYPIQGENGAFREPDWGVVEAMKMADTWSGDYELPSDDIEAAEEVTQASQAAASEQRKEEITSNFRAAKRLAGDGGLTKRLWAKGAVPLGDK